jgi:hypothetical protein
MLWRATVKKRRRAGVLLVVVTAGGSGGGQDAQVTGRRDALVGLKVGVGGERKGPESCLSSGQRNGGDGIEDGEEERRGGDKKVRRGRTGGGGVERRRTVLIETTASIESGSRRGEELEVDGGETALILSSRGGRPRCRLST